MAGKYDWEPIEKSYRTGKYSNRQLSKIHGPSEATIRKRAKDFDWKKDLSKPVNQRIKEKLTNKAAEDEALVAPSDEDIVEAAANTAATIVFHHRSYAQKGREITGLLLDKLKQQMEAGTMKVAAFGQVVETDIPLDYMGKTLSAATQSLERLVKIERQAFRLDDDDQNENPNADLSDDELDKKINEFAHKKS
tara:strand:+ start:8315 stop:8893 length:579 start_codon:yes stop_codon:yes gene_type:complete